jgi:hypothetical protein|tara:strand:- start:10716 stop:11102 length:387 start_codon:yes stop_codon:yes gene_type:complete
MTPSQISALEHCGIKVEDATGDIKFREFEFIDIIKTEPLKSPKSNIQYTEYQEATKLPDYNKVGNIIDVYLAWRGSSYMIKMFFPSVKKPSRREVQIQMQKVYPGAKLYNYQISNHDPGAPILQTTRG